MPRPIAYITTPPSSFEEKVKHLRIPKARQKVLLKMIEGVRQQLSAEDRALLEDSRNSKEPTFKGKPAIANAAR